MSAKRVELKITGDWKRMASAVDSKRFKENLEANINKATTFNGMMMAGEIRRRIKARRYAKNSPLTVMLKKSSTPLIDDADLWGAVTSKNLDSYTVFIGILRTTLGTDGKPLINLAELLHNGGALQVTEHMRNMFILLAEVGAGKREASTLEGRAAEMAKALGNKISQIKPLKPSTTHIVIPPRPFLLNVLNDPTMHKKCENNWRKAVQASMKDQASGSPTKGGSTTPTGQAAVPEQGKAKQAKTPANRSEAARRGWKTRRKNQEQKGSTPSE